MKSGPTHVELAANRFRRWWPWLLVSFFLHLPLTPLGPAIGLLGLLMRGNDEGPEEPVEALMGIPVELLAGPASEAPPPSEGIPAPPEPAVVIAPEKPKKPKPIEAADAGVPEPKVADAGVELADGGTGADGGVDLDGGVADGGVRDLDAGTEADAGSPAKPDPFAIAGDFPTPPKTNVNVKLHLFAGNLARHPAGTAIATLLSQEPQWQDFVGPGGLDPVSDISRIAIYGPQLVDSSKVAVVLEYSAETEAVIKAVDALVKKTDGSRWATEKKKRVAYVTAAGAERVIIFFPGKVIAIVPEGPVHEQLIAAKAAPPLPLATDDSEVFQASLRTPHRVRFFRNALKLEIPQSIEEARLFVSALPNGGAKLHLDLNDANAEAAAAHMPDLERQASVLTLGMVRMDFRVVDSRIEADATVSPVQIAVVLSRINQEIQAARKRRAGR